MAMEKVILKDKDQKDIIMKGEREKPENQNQNGSVIT